MAGLGSRRLIDVKKLFFDKHTISKSLDKSKYIFLLRAGALVRRTSQFSIRKSSKRSRPGQPPKGHGKQILRNSIFFGIDKRLTTDDCLVGPIYRSPLDKSGRPTSGTVPSVLEHGGDVLILEVYQFGKWRRLNRNKRTSGLPVRYRKVHIEARPFMGPALDNSKPKFASLMRGTFKKG